MVNQNNCHMKEIQHLAMPMSAVQHCEIFFFVDSKSLKAGLNQVRMACTVKYIFLFISLVLTTLNRVIKLIDFSYKIFVFKHVKLFYPVMSRCLFIKIKTQKIAANRSKIITISIIRIAVSLMVGICKNKKKRSLSPFSHSPSLSFSLSAPCLRLYLTLFLSDTQIFY